MPEYYYIFIIFKYLIFFFIFLIFFINKTIYSVFLLIINFILGAAIFIFFKAYFVGLLLIIVYIGAVSVLFLFVTMMINIKDDKNIFIYWWKIILMFSVFIFFKKIIVFKFQIFRIEEINYIIFFNNFIYDFNISIIGNIIYTYYIIPFIICSFILLVAMIGAIILTNKFKYSNSFKQDISIQINQDQKNSFVLKQGHFYKIKDL